MSDEEERTRLTAKKLASFVRIPTSLFKYCAIKLPTWEDLLENVNRVPVPLTAAEAEKRREIDEVLDELMDQYLEDHGLSRWDLDRDEYDTIRESLWVTN